MIEAHKSRHHNVSGKGGSGGGGTYHWNSSSSLSSQSESNQKEPLFDWDASSVSTSESERIQEVTTTLGQTAFLHCRVRYLADRRVRFCVFTDLFLPKSFHSACVCGRDYQVLKCAIHSSEMFRLYSMAQRQ